MTVFQRLRYALARFMAGRYGSDQLNHFLFGLYFALWILSFLFRGWLWLVVDGLATLTAVWLLYRTLSRNIPRRQAENERFLRWWLPVKRWFGFQFTRLRDIRRFRYRRCPSCRSMLRLPIKRGRRTVTCHRCHTQFKAFFL